MKLKKLIAAALLAALVIPVSVPQPAFAAKTSVVKRAKGKKKNGKKRKGKFYFKVDKAPKLIKFYWPGMATRDAANNTFYESFKYGSKEAQDTLSAETDIEGANLNQISAYVTNNKRLKCISSNPSILKVQKAKGLVKSYATYYLIPLKSGTSTISVTYPGGKYKRKISVKPSQVYNKVKTIVNEVKNSGLDDAHKAFLLAGWQCKVMNYGRSGYSGLYGSLIKGKGVCYDYSVTYNFLCKLTGITCRLIGSHKLDHDWNQIKINGNWYNVDVTHADHIDSIAGGENFFDETQFMKSDDAYSYAKKRAPEEYKNYKALSKEFDNYYWTPFITENSIAKKYGINTEKMYDEWLDKKADEIADSINY